MKIEHHAPPRSSSPCGGKVPNTSSCFRILMTTTSATLMVASPLRSFLFHVGRNRRNNSTSVSCFIAFLHVIAFPTCSLLCRRVRSPYTLSLYQQVMLCVERGFQRLRADASITITGLVMNNLMALVIGSVFYNLQDNTGSFYSRGALLYFAILINAFAAGLEVILNPQPSRKVIH